MADGRVGGSQMLFTWDTNNLCIVFRQWHIRSTPGLIFSLLAIVAIGAGYELLREGIRRYEHNINKRTETAPRESLPSPAHPPAPSHHTPSLPGDQATLWWRWFLVVLSYLNNTQNPDEDLPH